MKRLREAGRIAGAFVGIVVGAGFASGQESIQFFTSFGMIGLVGIVISSALFIFMATALSLFGQHYRASSHKDVIYAICGKYLGVFVDALLTFFMFTLAVVMIAGSGALLRQLTGAPLLWGSIIVTVLSVVIVCLDFRHVITLISSITPLLVLLVAIVSLSAITGRDVDIETLQIASTSLPSGTNNWLLGALLYTSYNVVAGTPFLIIMGGQTTDYRTAIWGGIIGGALLGVLMLLVTASLYARANVLAGVPVPMLLLATQSSPIVGIAMGIVIFGMTLNTTVGALYSFSARFLQPGSASFRWGTILAGLLAFIGSLFGFTHLVGTAYPFFGYLGSALMAGTIIGWIKVKRGSLSPMRC